jgi:hypothetical protein
VTNITNKPTQEIKKKEPTTTPQVTNLQNSENKKDFPLLKKVFIGIHGEVLSKCLICVTCYACDGPAGNFPALPLVSVTENRKQTACKVVN